MTKGQRAYEADLLERPCYHDGETRPGWHELSALARWAWERERRLQAATDENATEWADLEPAYTEEGWSPVGDLFAS